MKRLSRFGIVAGFLAAAVAVTACGGDSGSGGSGGGQSTLPQGSESVDLNPADFTTEITNPYWPMKPGSKWVYKETDSEGSVMQVEVTVTNEIKQIANGMEARVVHDVVTEGGEPVEITDDYYAQDKDGNLWYLGEDTAEYKNGKVASREGSFEAGVDGAQPGIILPAEPKPGQAYRQEYYKGQAEDRAEISALGETVTVPFGKFTDTVKTEDINPLDDPPAVENKFYAKDVGPVLVLGVSGSAKGSREELVSYAPGG
jgi:hypothetical protein